ncbi:MAG: hypothetical protein QGH40_00895, partial [bacterium]|nr:hypothetical protein [bacterium]
MRTFLFKIVTVVLLLFSIVPLALAQDKAEWVARQVDQRDTGRDASLEMEMHLVDKKGIQRLRRLFIVR